LIVDDALLLDREQAATAVRVAYDRDTVDISLNGEYDEMLKSFDKNGHVDMAFVSAPPFQFYEPKEIADRQRRWQMQADAEARRSARAEAPLVTRTPAGYTQGKSGGLVSETKVGRNDPCPCGSGKKYKKCCDA
jgi:preprotein translocase subunit SecA